ncbi:MAG: 4Fe-4S dicluster domain-containing protein [Chloroflexi bacterium]|nr:4Fe-4S dicluster domain-containing protein [Chloroflexota bacterium]
MNEMNKMDALFVGAGPASLAGAIRLKQLLNGKNSNASVVVIEKAAKLGQHNLSGALFEADVLDELLPGWKERKEVFVTKMLANSVEKDEMIFLFGQDKAARLPESLVPSYMHHRGNLIISASELVNWLGGIARQLGVEIYTGFAAQNIVTGNGAVRGVKLGDKGLDKEGNKMSNYLPGDVLEAGVTVFGEGSLGLRAGEVIKEFGLDKGRNPPAYAIGVKEIIRLPEKNNFGPNRVIHTFGFPNSKLTPDVYGGGTLYSMGPNLVAVAIILGLDWRYSDLNPQLELQIFKSHRLIKELLQGGEVIAYGAKTLPEGGYYSMPEVVANGAMLIGDSAGLTNPSKLKGLHYAMKSGMLAAETIARAIEGQDFSRETLRTYQEELAKSFIGQDLRAARNYRQVFAAAGRAGIYLGAPLSLVQQWLPGKVGLKPDYEGMRKVRLNRKSTGMLDRLTEVSLSGTSHREDEPSHITFADPQECARCGEKFGCHPCEYFCPAEVYDFQDDKLVLSPSNCVHCQTCRVKCPLQVIRWNIPEGGDGPRYKMM